MDKYLSKKIYHISFALMLLIVFLHAYNIGVANNTYATTQYPVNLFVQNFVSQGIARIAVPMFFMISGYSGYN